MRKKATKFKTMTTALACFSLIASALLAQDKGTIVGTVSSTETEGVLAGANVTIAGTLRGSSVSSDGTYSMVVEPGTYTVRASFIGYSTAEKEVQVVSGETVTINFLLEEDVLSMNDILVTGTRNRGRTAIQSPVPIDNFSGLMLERQGNGDMTETLKNVVPSFAATPLTGDGAAFVRPTSLRGLPPDEVLILVNSKRRHRSALISHFGAAMNVGAQAADIGHIPGLALKNLEVLRDGASAQYGSDAIAGVMNFILKDASDGIEVQAQSGVWYEGENENKVAVNVGLPLTSKGFLNITGEYSTSPELSRGGQDFDAIGVVGAKDPAMNWGRPKTNGFRGVWNAGIQLNQKAQLYSFGNYADTYGRYSFFYRDPGNKDLQTMPSDPNNANSAPFSWANDLPAGFTPQLEGDQTDLGAVAGLKGNFDNGLVYDVSTSYGSNRLDYLLLGSLNGSYGPDSQRDFHPGDLKQENLNFNLDLSYAVSSNLNIAGGAEWRQETYTMFAGDEQSWNAGPYARVGDLIDPATGANYTSPGVGANGMAGTNPNFANDFVSENWATYVDAEWDASEDLLLQLALRHEDYKEFGTTDDFKVAGRYNVSEGFVVRGAVSTGFRVPSPGQANVTTIVTTFDGITQEQTQEGTISPTSTLAQQFGGKALTPEEAVNISIGIAANPNESLRFSADVYQIEVSDRIVKSRNIVIDGNPSFAQIAFYTNSLETKTRGFDLVATWNGSRNTDVSLAYNYNNTEVVKQTQVNDVNPVSDQGVFNLENNLPKHRATVTLNQKFGKIGTTLRGNFYGSTRDESGPREDVDAAMLLDLEVSYPLANNITVIGGANNLLNQYPTKIDTRLSQGMPYPRRTPIGYLGGMAYLRVIYNF